MKQTRLLKLLFLFLLLTFSHATTLKQAVENALVNNPEVMSLQKNSEAYRLYIDEEEGAYYPSINLDAFLEKKNEIKEPQDDAKTKSKQQGYNAQIKLEQMIYDGGLTPAKVDEAKYNYQETKIKNISTIENIIFEVTQSYLDLVKYKELLILSENNIAIHDSYLETAKQSEEVSGETLDRIQVESKLFLATSKLFQQKDDQEVSLHSFNKLVGYEPSGQICKPSFDTALIPSDVKKAVDESLKNSFTVLEQIEIIKAQRAIVSQEKSRFLPTLTFELQDEWDDDLDTAKTKTSTQSAKLKLSYNIFNGNKDKATEQRERIFLQESQKLLDDTVNVVEQDIKSAYSNYLNSLSKIIYLKLYVEKTQEILDVYKEQFLGGTRTFIDILNSEAEVFSAKTQLIEEEYSLLSSYYEILLILSKLSDTIVMQDNQVCKEMIVDTNPKALNIAQSQTGDLDSDDADLSEIADLLDDESSADINEATKKANLGEIDKTLDLNANKVEDDVSKERLVKDLVNDILNDVYELNEIEDSTQDAIIEEKLIEKEAKKILQAPVVKSKSKVSKKEKLIKPESNLSKKDNKILKKVINETPKKTINEKKLKKILTQPLVPEEENKEEKNKEDKTEKVKADQKEKQAQTEALKPFKVRFLNTNDSNYTINLKTFISFAEAEKFVQDNESLSDTFGFKFGRNLEFVKLINGIYLSYDDANKALTTIQKQMKTDEFIIDTIKHQKDIYKKYNVRYKKPQLKETKVNAVISQTKIKKPETKKPKVSLEKIDNNLMAKINFLKAKSGEFTVNVSSFNSLDELYTFMEDNSLGNKAFAFRFGNNQKLIKLLYGTYETSAQAQNDFNKIDTIKDINPVLERIQKYQKLYALNYNIKDETKQTLKTLGFKSIEELNTLESKKVAKQVSKTETLKQSVKKVNTPKLKKEAALKRSMPKTEIQESEEKKQTTSRQLTKTELEIEQIKKDIQALEDEIKAEEEKLNKQVPMNNKSEQSTQKTESIEEKIEQIKIVEDEITLQEKKIEQSITKKPQAKNDRKQMKGILFVDPKSKAKRDLPLEFVSKKSDYYTIMVLDFKSMNEAKGYVQRYGLNDNTVIFNYARKYKVIHGAYKTFSQANKAIKNLQPFVKKTKPYVRKISGYQALYRKYHLNSKKIKAPSTKNIDSKKVEPIKKVSNNDKKLSGISFSNSRLKKEFLNTKSKRFTITLTTSPSFKEARWFRHKHNVQKNTIVYKFRNQVKVIYGIYKSSKEADAVIKGFSKGLKAYKPFVNRLSTHQKLYKKYNKNIEE